VTVIGDLLGVPASSCRVPGPETGLAAAYGSKD
jgi:hypothetical protein